MVNKVSLQFDKTLTRLAGYPFGKETYEKQVLGKINFAEEAVIEFPKQIVKAASSFVQGFFAPIIDAVGFSGIDTKVKIVCSDSLKDSILTRL